jgi:hypothetical protein
VSETNELANIHHLVAAKELAARNTVVESVHDFAVGIHAKVEEGEIDNPLDVVDAIYRFIQDGFAASIHMAYAEEIVTQEQAIDAFKMIYGWDEKAAKEAFDFINVEYHKQREAMADA